MFDLSQLGPILRDWQGRLLRQTGIQRDIDGRLMQLMGSKPIKIVTGFRRSGKSFLVQKIAKQRIEQQAIEIDNVCYLNFEDIDLSTIQDAKALNQVFQYFMKTLAKPGPKLLILDEIQLVTDWDRLVRSIYEKHADVEMILTGSNSELLSSELGSHLSGRFVELFVSPFSFAETLSYHGNLPKSEAELERSPIEYHQAFHQYVQFGGLPEQLSIKDEIAKKSYIEGIISKVVLDDVVKRFNVRQVDVLEKILQYLLINPGNIISPSKLNNYLKNLHAPTKPFTVSTYIDYFLKTFALHAVDKMDWRTGRVFNTTKKYYPTDPGLTARYQSNERCYGKQLESIMMMELIRQYGRAPSYGMDDKNQHEIDFIIEATPSIYARYQITRKLHEDNFTRELAAFAEKTPYQNKQDTLLVLENPEAQFEVPKNVRVRPLINWLLFR